MPAALITALIVLLQHVFLISPAGSTHPAIKSGAVARPAMIRGLVNLDERQTGFCFAPEIYCGSHCCPDSSWECCINGACCEHGTYCFFASDGNIGCCNDGEICGGPVGPPQTIGDPNRPTPTITTTIKGKDSPPKTADFPTTNDAPPTDSSSSFSDSFLTSNDAFTSTESPTPLITTSSLTFSDPLSFPTVTGPTTTFTPNGLASFANKPTENTVVTLGISTLIYLLLAMQML